MPNRSRSFRGSSGRKSTNYGWVGVNDIGNSIGTGATKVLLGGITLSNPSIDETWLRFVGMIGVESDQIIATEAQIGAFGMIVVSNNAFAAGAVSIPGPVADAGDDGWFVSVPFANTFQFITGSGFNPSGQTQRYFDFKSKRKVQEGEQIALMVESIAGSQGFTFNVMARGLSMVRGT